MLKLRCASDRRSLTLNPKATLGEGGEGSVFAAGNRLAAKIYRKPSEATQRKLKAMLAQTSAKSLTNQDVSIAWPLDLLLDEAGEIVGFLMPQALASRPIVDYYNPKTRLGFSPFFSYRDLHRTARNLAAAIETLHAQGYVVGDLNESNILVSQSAQVTLVDADSIQVIDGETLYHCRVGKAEFMPPELQGQSLSAITRTTEQDNFALAILIFQTLMEGSHPFAGIYIGEGEPPTLAARIGAGHFPYSEQPIPYRPSPLALPFTILHPKLQAFFQSCFVDSQQIPQNRPTAAHWREALTVAEQDLRPCTVNPRHAYGSHLDACPWCYRKALLKDRDPFPEKIDSPKPIPVAAKPKKLPVLSILVGISFAFIAAMLFALRLGAPNPNSYLIGTVQPKKLQISFCKEGNRLSFPEDKTLEFLSSFKADCSSSSLRLTSSIFKYLFTHEYAAWYTWQSGSDDAVLLSKSFKAIPKDSYSLSIRDFDAAEALRTNFLSPNGFYFASLIEEEDRDYFSSYVLLSDVRSNKVLTRLRDEDAQISALAFSSDSKFLALGESNGTVKIYSIASSEIILEIHPPDSLIKGLKFIAKDKILCIAGKASGYRLVNVASGRTISVFGLSNFSTNAIAFSPLENRVALASNNNQIQIYETQSGKTLRTLATTDAFPEILIFSNNGKQIAVGSSPNTIRVYDLQL